MQAEGSLRMCVSNSQADDIFKTLYPSNPTEGLGEINVRSGFLTLFSVV